MKERKFVCIKTDDRFRIKLGDIIDLDAYDYISDGETPIDIVEMFREISPAEEKLKKMINTNNNYFSLTEDQLDYLKKLALELNNDD